MQDIDYASWVDYIEDIFEMHGIKPELVLELGCGTGNICIEMAVRGYDMIGSDISGEMLSYAKNKSVSRQCDILFLNQDMTCFELYGTVDVIICMMDSINYILKKNDLKKMFKLVNNYLNPGGLFIFDINTEYKFNKIFADNVFHEIREDAAYIWENKYDKSKKVCRFDLTLFLKKRDVYERYDEIHYERAYTADEIKVLIESSGLQLAAVYDELSFKKPLSESERIFLICKKEDVL